MGVLSVIRERRMAFRQEQTKRLLQEHKHKLKQEKQLSQDKAELEKVKQERKDLRTPLVSRERQEQAKKGAVAFAKGLKQHLDKNKASGKNPFAMGQSGGNSPFLPTPKPKGPKPKEKAIIIKVQQ